jgi:ArsR family transcriptional regulator, arsenate/arsenite/antimonite-responsive transcriptional repressor
MAESRTSPDSVAFAKAIADDTRQKIMKYCCCDWRSVTEIFEHAGVTQPTVSHHLAILRDAGLVDIRHDGKQTFYRLNQKRIVNCCGALSLTFAPEETAAASAEKARR